MNKAKKTKPTSRETKAKNFRKAMESANKKEKYFCPDCNVEIDEIGREIKNPKNQFRHNYPTNLLVKKRRNEKIYQHVNPKCRCNEKKFKLHSEDGPVWPKSFRVATIATKHETKDTVSNFIEWIELVLLSIMVGMSVGIVLVLI